MEVPGAGAASVDLARVHFAFIHSFTQQLFLNQPLQSLGHRGPGWESVLTSSTHMAGDLEPAFGPL